MSNILKFPFNAVNETRLIDIKIKAEVEEREFVYRTIFADILLTCTKFKQFNKREYLELKQKFFLIEGCVSLYSFKEAKHRWFETRSSTDILIVRKAIEEAVIEHAKNNIQQYYEKEWDRIIKITEKISELYQIKDALNPIPNFILEENNLIKFD